MAGPFRGMPGGMGNLGGGGMQKMIENLQKKLMEDAERMQQKLGDARFEGTAGGAVIAVADGLGHLLELTISPDAVDPIDVEMLQDMVLTAVREALEKAEETREEEQQKLTQGMPSIPGLF